MKINTFKQYKFTAELWQYFITRDSEGGEIRNYSLARVVNVDVNTTGQGRLFVNFPVGNDDVREGYRLHVLRDTLGQSVIANGVFEINSVEPLFNQWGFREGLRARAQLMGVDGTDN